ncbi:hypothetical protein GCM10010495_48340 [Kitasatospora herbaricolor]|nr:hypothetical protein [Kitasatospora herbaricolor]GGV26753.1 hypothetical protein GCM10010495_48340 [Kitasatospora herbaricolor]
MTYEPFFDNYFLPLGYAVADLDAIGTGQSQGCVDPGSADEQAGVKAAIDWLNGSATGYDTDGNPITAADSGVPGRASIHDGDPTGPTPATPRSRHRRRASPWRGPASCL